MINKLIKLLKENYYSPSELMKILEIKDKNILINYIKKINKIAKRKGWKFIIIPARCKSCGYVFEKEIKVPTKCPKCKSEWIEEPKFYIEI